MKDTATSGIIGVADNSHRRWAISFMSMSRNITQDITYRQFLMRYVEKCVVSRASRKYNKSRSYIYFWKDHWDGTAESLAYRSRRPHSHSQPAYRSGAKADPGHAPPQSRSWHGGSSRPKRGNLSTNQIPTSR